ncbi:MAG TPA: aminopeptidase P family protein, partial [Anaerolineae bacterium]|nr:aminopeptidase P family protein [Anaerolineae bacterium]
FRNLLEASEFDAVIALSPENFSFTAGCFVWTQSSIRDRLALTVWAKGEPEPVVIVCEVEEPQVRADSWVRDVRSYVEFYESPMERVAEVLHEKGLEEGRLGIEMRYISAAYFRDFTQRVPKARFLSCEDLFCKARMIKTFAEIELLTQAARATEKALLATYVTIEVGETEKSMANRLATSMRHCGLDHVTFLYINAGPNTSYPHQDATQYQAKSGDIVKSDVGGLLRGYPSDVARTAVIGQPSAEQLSIYNRLVEIHAETIKMARPGNRACDLYNKAKEEYAKRGIPFSLPHAGHGIGLEGHEVPLLTALDTTEFKPNMTICVETRVRWVQKEGYHIEDLILITDEGPKILTTYFDSGEIFVV